MSVTQIDYHSDTTTLSNSGAKWLLPPHCPAKFRWIQDHPQDRPVSAALDFGKAAHRYAFGAGEDFIVITGSGKDPNAWNTTATKDEVQQARAAGLTPIKPQDEAIIREMGDALRVHPRATELFGHRHGKAEVPLYWTDPATGVPLRCRLDWLPTHPRPGTRMVIPDYKTAESAHPEKFRKSAADYRYHCQAAWYLDGLRECGIDDDPAFVFVVQEKSPPYLVQVIELDDVALTIGRNLNHQARALYAECVRTNRWPGYSETVERISLPEWYLAQHDEELEIAV